MGKKIDRTGEIGVNNDGERMIIVRYGYRRDIDVQFDDGTVVQHRRYNEFLKGSIRNPMTPSLFGFGFIGVGDYKTCDGNGKTTKCYEVWSSMYKRCYSSKVHEREQTYENCTVCKEWNNYQAFAKWFDINYYEIENERMTLDKDILCKGNKVYSPKTCVFTPQFINTLFIKCDKRRGEYPLGVFKRGDKFGACLSKDNRNIDLGTYSTIEEAFLAYKQAKEQYIKEVAEEYKQKIPYELYQAMMNYEIEITD